jgi:hypothetical protein
MVERREMLTVTAGAVALAKGGGVEEVGRRDKQALTAQSEVLVRSYGNGLVKQSLRSVLGLLKNQFVSFIQKLCLHHSLLRIIAFIRKRQTHTWNMCLMTQEKETCQEV